MAEPARTRRSSRETAVRVTVTPGDSAETGLSRAELRRRAGSTGEIARPAVVWARPVSKDAEAAEAAPVIVESVTAEVLVEVAPVEVQPAATAPVILPATEPTVISVAPVRRSRVRPVPVAPEFVAQVIDSEQIVEPEPAVEAEQADAVEPEPEAEPQPVVEVIVPEPEPDAEAEPEPAAEVAAPEPIVAEPTEVFELIEPAVDAAPQVEPEPTPAEVPEPSEVADEFEAAARLWGFTGETPVQKAAEPEQSPKPVSASHKAPRGRAKSRTAVKRMAAASFSMGVMTIVGLLTVSMTLPAEAVAAVNGTDVDDVAAVSIAAPAADDAEVEDEEIQAFVAPAQVENAEIARTENYDSVTIAEIASEEGIRNFSNFFVNDPNSPIQWPFAVGVPMTYGFGFRSGQLHAGLDFTPGAGAPIQAIADGVVRVSTDSGGAYGVHIIIDHVIDGQVISSHYAHMQYGSRQVEVGQHITVGTVIGRTGNTGRSYGAHTHFEILMNGTTPIDPLPWLREHAGG